MEHPYQIILDLWEANKDIQPDALKAEGVVGLIVRLNDMNGGHHMDELFAVNWAKAKMFPVNSIYFVYNPWVTAEGNYFWLMSHLPSDFGKRRLFVDIEVRYPSYPPATYAAETAKFMAMVRKIFPASRYSGGGYLDILSYWPRDEEYWWAAYSTSLRNSVSWEDYRRRLSVLNYAMFTKLSPGPARLWQATGDGLRLPGFGNHAVDTNIFPGTLEQARAWFGNDKIVEGETPMGIPIGLLTDKEGWSDNNPGFNFVAGYAQERGTVQPNPNIKPIELEARKMKVPFLLYWVHDPEKYSEQQWGETNWPDLKSDYIVQNFISILEVRSYDAVVIDVSKYKTAAGKPENPAFLSFAAKMFVERVSGWLRQNRPLVPLIVAGSEDMMTQYAPNMKNWIGNYPNMPIQLTPTKDSYPIAGAKPQYLGAAKEAAWWRYYQYPNSDNALMVFRGEPGYSPTVEGMCSWLNYEDDGGEIPGDGDDSDDTDLEKTVKELVDVVNQMQTEIDRILVALQKPILS